MIFLRQMYALVNLVVNRNNKCAGNLSCLTFARKIFNKGEEEYFEWVLDLLHKAKWNEFPQSHCHRIISSLYEIRRSVEEESAFVQRKLVDYLKKTNPDELLINATVKYPQFKDESKKIKLFLIDVVNGDSANNIIDNQNRFIA